MKKFIVVLLSVSMMTMCLFGCGAKEESAATPEASEESAATSADEKDSVETMKITVSIASFDNTFASFTMSRMKLFNEEHPELEITYLDAANDAATQLLMEHRLLSAWR